MSKKTYAEKLLDPRWQKKRLEVFNRDKFTCLRCGDNQNTLHVHHKSYNGEPWEAELSELETVCCNCHNKEHNLPIPATHKFKSKQHPWEIYPPEYDEQGRLKYTKDNPDYPTIYKSGHNEPPLIISHRKVLSDKFGTGIHAELKLLYKNMVDSEKMSLEDYHKTGISFSEWKESLINSLHEKCKLHNVIITRGNRIYGAEDMDNLKNFQYF